MRAWEARRNDRPRVPVQERTIGPTTAALRSPQASTILC